MDVPNNLYDEIKKYCRLNDITDLDAFILKSLQQGFNIEKYGPTPFTVGKEKTDVIEKEVIKEVIVEKIVEIEVEKIVEIEVEKIVEVTVTDNELIDKLQKNLDDNNFKLQQIVKEKNAKIDSLNEEISDLSNKMSQLQKEYSDNDLIKQLKQKNENLKIELELEKNRNYQPPKIEEKQTNNPFGNIINWISKTERGDKDIYEE